MKVRFVCSFCLCLITFCFQNVCSSDDVKTSVNEEPIVDCINAASDGSIIQSEYKKSFYDMNLSVIIDKTVMDNFLNESKETIKNAYYDSDGRLSKLEYNDGISVLFLYTYSAEQPTTKPDGSTSSRTLPITSVEMRASNGVALKVTSSGVTVLTGNGETGPGDPDISVWPSDQGGDNGTNNDSGFPPIDTPLTPPLLSVPQLAVPLQEVVSLNSKDHIDLDRISKTSFYVDFKEIKKSILSAQTAQKDAQNEYIKRTNSFYRKVYQELKINGGKFLQAGIDVNMYMENVKNEDFSGPTVREDLDNAVRAVRKAGELSGENPVFRDFIDIVTLCRKEVVDASMADYTAKLKEAFRSIEGISDILLRSDIGVYLSKKNNRIDIIISLFKDER